MAEKALDLFQAYAQNKLPKEGGYVVSTFFASNSVYSIYEVVAYNGVKSIYLTEEGLTWIMTGTPNSSAFLQIGQARSRSSGDHRSYGG